MKEKYLVHPAVPEDTWLLMMSLLVNHLKLVYEGDAERLRDWDLASYKMVKKFDNLRGWGNVPADT